ncbi:MAG TPA: glycoside hydrolase family 3 C-terminal domain-containing protein [Acidimicrobiia bacterium]|nr:glycoside hydrolase family 3 C-terminal domain-containing protein [Acidimicrobiia bacterium]
MSDRLEQILAGATTEELAASVTGADLWSTPGIARLGAAGLRVTDGPNGARGGRWTGLGAACFPCGSLLGATWDPALVERVGRAIAQEARTKGAHVLLAPTVNLHRHPLAGRNFECYSEDPHLSARLAVGFVRGAQGEGVAVTVKHFVANDSEHERMTISSEVDEAVLRELYLVPFEAAVREAGAWGVMSAYNRLNGTYCSEHPWLLTTVLRDEWGFDGFVISDWFGTHATAAAAEAGLDLEMPGPPQWFGPRLATAVEVGEVGAETLFGMAANLLRASARTGALDGEETGPARAVDDPTHRALAREAAAAGFVLLQNRNAVLPIDRSTVSRIALVGPGADVAWIMGGGSASLTPHYSVTPLDGITEAVHETTTVGLARGPASHRTVPILDNRTLDGDVTVDYFPTTDWTGPVALTESVPTSRLVWMGHWTDEFDGSRYSARARSTLRPTEGGEWTFGLTTVGPCRVLLDDEVIFDVGTDRPRGESFFGFGSPELTATVPLRAGEPRTLTIEYSSAGPSMLGGFALGAAPPEPPDAFDRAVGEAAEADVAIVVVGTGADWESEGHDRTSIELPRNQAALVRAVAAANPRTVVCVNAAAPISMDWADDVPAVLVCGLPGQEWGHALADVLFGAVEPGGRLPTTLPVRLDDTPSHATYPGENGRVHYAEGLLMGYRGYDTRGIEPRFCFGHGLGYTTFEYGPARVGDTTVFVDVTNTGDRPGAAVVQCYVHEVAAPTGLPDQELRAFEKVRLESGETRTVSFELGPRAFAHWRDGWVIAAGTYELRIGASSRDIRARATIEVPGGTVAS